MARVRLVKACGVVCAWFTILCLCSLLAKATPSTTWPSDLKEKVDAFVENIIKCRNIVGMSVAIVKGKDIVHSQGYGLADMEKNIKFTNQTLTNVASLSKAFGTALLSKQLSMTNGLYNWDTPVRTILGDDFFFYNKELTLQATLRDLGVHRTGIIGHNNIRLMNITREQMVKRIRFIKPLRGFRFTYAYNNIMYSLLTYVSDVLGKTSWEELITKYIYTPLSMTGSSFSNVADLNAENVAKAYHTYNGSFVKTPLSTIRHWGTFGASGAILTNSDGMGKWMLMHLNEGKNQDGVQVVPRDLLKETHDPFVNTPLPSDWYTRPDVPVTYVYDRYSPGWRTGHYRGMRAMMHRGTSWGYGAFITLIPSLKIGVFTGINSYDASYMARHLTHTYLLDVAMGEEPWLNLTTACTFPKPWVNASQPKEDDYVKIDKTRTASLPLKNYVASYGHYATGNISVTLGVAMGSLHVTFGIIGQWDIWPYAGNVFKGEYYEKAPAFKPTVTFISSKQNSDIDKVTIFYFQFTRDLKMANAPPPPKLDDGCIILSPAPPLLSFLSHSTLFSLLLIVFFVIGN